MLKDNLVPKASRNFFQNLKVNWVPRSGTISLGNAVKTYDSVDVESCQPVAIISGLDRNEIDHLGQMIDYDPDGVVSFIRPW